MFLDASAIVGILNDEDEKEELLVGLEKAKTPFMTSPIAIVESVIVLASRLGVPVLKSHEIVGDFLQELKAQTVSITPEIGNRAIQAYADYGKGKHPARLNLGDCFAYACAKNYTLPLLYKGEDFKKTDLA